MTFQFNKTYRTRCGQHVKEVRQIGNRFLRGYRLCDGADYVWHPDGRVVPGQNTFDDLMPGAIEDEKPEGRSTPYTNEERLDEAYRRIEAQTSVIAGMAAKIEAQQDQLTRHANRISSHHDQIDTARREIAVLASGMNDHTKQIGTLQEAQIKTFARLDHHNIRLPTPDEQPTKRTIKGGWLNVYLTRWGVPARVGAFCSTKEEADRAAQGADHRIACIQIPDITEGEGL